MTSLVYERETSTGELSRKPDEMLGVTCDGLASHPGGVAILLVASCNGNRDKLRPCGQPGSCADFIFFILKVGNENCFYNEQQLLTYRWRDNTR